MTYACSAYVSTRSHARTHVSAPVLKGYWYSEFSLRSPGRRRRYTYGALIVPELEKAELAVPLPFLPPKLRTLSIALPPSVPARRCPSERVLQMLRAQVTLRGRDQIRDFVQVLSRPGADAAECWCSRPRRRCAHHITAHRPLWPPAVVPARSACTA